MASSPGAGGTGRRWRSRWLRRRQRCPRTTGPARARVGDTDQPGHRDHCGHHQRHHRQRAAGALHAARRAQPAGHRAAGRSQSASPLARLTPGANGNASAWQSYINVIENAGGAGPGTEDRTAGGRRKWQRWASSPTTATAATAIASPPTSRRVPESALRGHADPPGRPRDPRLRARWTTRSTISGPQRRHAHRPRSRGKSSATRRCNACHDKLAVHGGARFQHQYCVTCHNPGSADANSGNTVDETVMIHSIHRGAEPAVACRQVASMSIWGFMNGSTISPASCIPQDIRNCRGCHDEADPATPQAANWYNVPDRRGLWFLPRRRRTSSTGENHADGVAAANAECAICHGSGELRADAAHRQLELAAAQAFRFNILGVSDYGRRRAAGRAFLGHQPAGRQCRVRTSGRTRRSPAAAARSTSTWPGQPWRSAISTAAAARPPGHRRNRCASARSTDGDCPTATAATRRRRRCRFRPRSVDPASPRWRGASWWTSTATARAERIPVTGVSAFFAITDPAPQPRRHIVDLDGCNACHQVLQPARRQPHRRSRQLRGLPQRRMSLTSSAASRPASTRTTPRTGCARPLLHLSYMTHALHAGAARENAYIAYNRSGAPVSYGERGLPGPARQLQRLPPARQLLSGWQLCAWHHRCTPAWTGRVPTTTCGSPPTRPPAPAVTTARRRGPHGTVRRRLRCHADAGRHPDLSLTAARSSKPAAICHGPGRELRRGPSGMTSMTSAWPRSPIMRRTAGLARAAAADDALPQQARMPTCLRLSSRARAAAGTGHAPGSRSPPARPARTVTGSPPIIRALARAASRPSAPRAATPVIGQNDSCVACHRPRTGRLARRHPRQRRRWAARPVTACTSGAGSDEQPAAAAAPASTCHARAAAGRCRNPTGTRSPRGCSAAATATRRTTRRSAAACADRR